MSNTPRDVDLTDLVDGTLSGAEWDAWLVAHPDAAAEVAIGRRVRALISQMRDAAIVVPPGFEARLMARVHDDAALLDLLDLGLAGIGRAVIELLNLLFGLIPEPQVRAT